MVKRVWCSLLSHNVGPNCFPSVGYKSNLQHFCIMLRGLGIEIVNYCKMCSDNNKSSELVDSFFEVSEISQLKCPLCLREENDKNIIFACFVAHFPIIKLKSSVQLQLIRVTMNSVAIVFRIIFVVCIMESQCGSSVARCSEKHLDNLFSSPT